MTSTVQSAKFGHYLSANYLIPTSSNSGNPLRCAGALIETPHVTTVLATGTLAASALPNGFLLLNPGAPTALTLPTAANIVAAFTAAGNPLIVGNSFVVKFQNISGGSAVTFSSGAGLTPLRADSVVIAASKGGLIYFVATNVSTGTEAFSYSILMSAL